MTSARTVAATAQQRGQAGAEPEAGAQDQRAALRHAAPDADSRERVCRVPAQNAEATGQKGLV